MNTIDPYVLVIGAASIDTKGRAGSPLTLGSSTPGMVQVSVGGTARNVADNLARLGIETLLLSAVGNDGSGKRILNNADEVGLNTEHCLVLEGYRTSDYLAVLDEYGDLVMSVDDMEILSCLTPQLIEQHRALIQHAEMVILDSNVPEDTLAALFKIVKRYNIRICADPTSTTLAAKLTPYLADIYMITPNIAEAKVLCGCTIDTEDDALTAARFLVNAGVQIATVTLAEEGVAYASPHTNGHVPAVATEVVDSTGASDALTATVVFGLLNDIPVDESVRLGVSAAALTLACSDTVCLDLSMELLYEHLMI